MYRMNQKVIIPENWCDKNYICYGWIYGIEKIQDNTYLGTRGIKEYRNRFTRYQYKVIYEHMDRVCEKWYLDSELDKTNIK